MSSVGETLRRERLRTGLDLDKIAQETKISTRTLELIEADQFEKLPGGVFAKSFVRQYARAVGADEDEILRELERRLDPAPAPPSNSHEIAKQGIRVPPVARWRGGESRIPQNSSLPALVLVVLVVLACSGAYTLWQKSRWIPVAPGSNVAAGSAAMKAPDPAPAAPEPKPALEASGPTSAASSPASQANSSAASATESTAGTESAAGTMHVALTAAEPTWVRATANGKVVFTGIIEANETKSLEAAQPVTLRIGNAGGLSISLNGKSIPAVGPKGQVRVVQLSPDGGVQVAVPEKPPPAPPSAQEAETL